MPRPKGYKLSEESRRKISEKNAGKKRTKKQLKRLSIATRRRYKNGESLGFKKGNTIGSGRIPWNKGIKGLNLSSSNGNWKGGATKENQRIRTSIESALWREAVFARDNWTCTSCGARGVELHPDHIKMFAFHPELRFAIDNGRTLCAPCHRKTPTWGCRNHICCNS